MVGWTPHSHAHKRSALRAWNMGFALNSDKSEGGLPPNPGSATTVEYNIIHDIVYQNIVQKSRL